MKMNCGYLLVFILGLFLSYSAAAKVVLLPLNMGSHLMYFGRVASALVENGHQATIYIPSNNKIPADLAQGVQTVIYKVLGDAPFSNSKQYADIEIQALTANSTLEWIKTMQTFQISAFKHWNSDCEAMLETEVFRGMSEANYDLAVVDVVPYICYHTIPYKLNIPYVSLSIPFLMWAYRVPHLSSQWPNFMITSGSRMDFYQRLYAFSIDVLYAATMNNSDHYTRKHVPEKPAKGSGDLLSESSMWWYLYDLSIGYPKASMPNTLDIGDIMVRPAVPLNKEFLDIMANSKEGVILVSLGSHFDSVPEKWLQGFCEAFNSVKYTVLWKLKIKPPCHVHPNVHINSWMPQNDLLAHPKLVLFITHCGINSVMESVNHGKPMIGLPIALDQPYNAGVLKDKEMGKVLDLTTFTSEELQEAINEVITNNTYTENAEFQSRLMHSKELSPEKRVSFWVSHLVEFGDKHLKTAATELSIFEFLMIDIYFLLFCIASMIVLLLLGCMCLGFKCCKKLCKGKQNKVHAD